MSCAARTLVRPCGQRFREQGRSVVLNPFVDAARLRAIATAVGQECANQ